MSVHSVVLCVVTGVARGVEKKKNLFAEIVDHLFKIQTWKFVFVLFCFSEGKGGLGWGGKEREGYAFDSALCREILLFYACLLAFYCWFYLLLFTSLFLTMSADIEHDAWI